MSRPNAGAGSRRALWIAGFALLACLAALLLPYRRTGARLETYVTPPFDKAGTRISLVRPAGWEPWTIRAASSSVWNQIGGGAAVIEFRKDRPMEGLPAGLRALVPISDDYGSLILNVQPRMVSTTGKVRVPSREAQEELSAWRNSGVGYNASFVSASLDGYYGTISYNRSNEAAFRATHSAIMRSIRKAD